MRTSSSIGSGADGGSAWLLGFVSRFRSYDPVRLPHGPLPNTRVEAATSDRAGLPRLPASPFHRAMPITPMDRNGCICRLLPRPPGLPRCSGGSASISSLSRPGQALLTLRPAGSLNRPRRPSSRGSDPASHPARPLVSYQINRQLSGWNLPPPVIRAFGRHRTNQELLLGRSWPLW